MRGRIVCLRWIETRTREPSALVAWPGWRHWELVETVRGRSVCRADVWLNRNDVTWHVCDRDGIGGENSCESHDGTDLTMRDALYHATRCAIAAIVVDESEQGAGVRVDIGRGWPAIGGTP